MNFFDHVRGWMSRHQTQIGWCIIGWAGQSLLRDLAQGHLFGAFFNLVIIVINYSIVR